MNKNVTTIDEIREFEIAEHVPSNCLLINGKWEIDPESAEQEYLGAGTNYEDYVNIIEEDNERYNADDCEQEHDEDYRILTKKIRIKYKYTQEDREQYESDKSNYEDGRDSYYGWSMNGGGGRKNFSEMYGNGDYYSFEEWIMRNKDYSIEYID